MSSSIGNCIECNTCGQDNGFICKLDGDFYTTGEYARIRNECEMHGVSFNQKIDSVLSKLDMDTINIIKVLICESGRWDYTTDMEIIHLLDELTSMLSNGDDAQ